MAGLEVSEELTDDQLAAMSGGDILKQEVSASDVITFCTSWNCFWCAGRAVRAGAQHEEVVEPAEGSASRA